jgi:CheY-like chemotaxis protein
MNLVGNSLKFTKDGYVRVTLRELSHPPGAKKIPVEMAVIDTGKGIGKEFLKEQLFHPFSQENPLQTGTGLGLAIVNSIVRSENVNGKVDVWSSEGVGTEIRVSFDVEVIDDEDDSSSASSSSAVSVSSSVGRGYSISLLAFNHGLRGHVLSLDVLSSYAAAWQFELESAGLGDILIINDDEQKLGEIAMLGKPIIFMTTGRPSDAAEIRDQIRNSGGWIQFMHKPIGPSALRATLISAVQFLDPEHDEATTPGLQEERPPISRGSSGASAESNSTVSELSRDRFDKHSRESRAPLMRRRSEEHEAATSSARPSLAPRGMTYHHAPKRPMAAHEGSVHNVPVPGSGSVGGHSSTSSTGSPQPGSPTSAVSTISLADGGVMLKAAAVITEAAKTRTAARVLVVEDNIINRRVLAAFLQKWVSWFAQRERKTAHINFQGMEFHEAVDGQAGVDVFRHFPPKYFE